MHKVAKRIITSNRPVERQSQAMKTLSSMFLLARTDPATAGLSHADAWTPDALKCLKELRKGDSALPAQRFGTFAFSSFLREVGSDVRNFDAIARQTHKLIVDGAWRVDLTHKVSKRAARFEDFQREHAVEADRLVKYVTKFFPEFSVRSVHMFRRMAVSGLKFVSAAYRFQHVPLVHATYLIGNTPASYFGRPLFFLRVQIAPPAAAGKKPTDFKTLDLAAVR
jgi:hypothetical protein